MLERVQAYIPGAVIAGGYLRDLYLGMPYKDIDIFIPFTEDVDELIEQIRWKPVIETEYHPTTIREVHCCKYKPQTEITRVWDVVSYRQVGFEDTLKGVQIIMLQKGFTIQDRVERHDFGICQIWYDGVNTYCTDAFLQDFEQKTFTLVVCESAEEYNRSMRRWDRFKEKYTQFDLRYAPGVFNGYCAQCFD